MRSWAVSLHDVAPATWPDCERLLDVVAPYGIPVTLLVTPHLHRGITADADAAFVAALHDRVARGDEIVLHGYAHVDDAPAPTRPADWVRRRLLTDAEGEFAALDAREAARRLEQGKAMLTRIGLAPIGFVPPAWLLGDGARIALSGTTLAYTSTRDRLYALPEFEAVVAPSLVYSTRAAWRRTASRYWNRARLWQRRGADRVRVALHPAEARYERVLDEWRRLFDALATPRTPVLETAWLPRRPRGETVTVERVAPFGGVASVRHRVPIG
jgi:predicted deacetylase